MTQNQHRPTHPLNIRFPIPLYEELVKEAEKQNRNLSNMVLTLVIEGLADRPPVSAAEAGRQKAAEHANENHRI